MHKTLFLTLYLFINLPLFSQLQWLNPKPTGYHNRKICFVNKDTGYILNTNGDLLNTYDAGSTWQLGQHFAEGSYMSFKDSTGIISAYDGFVYVSTDKGKTWQPRLSGVTGAPVWVQAVSRDTIFLVSSLNGTLSYYNKLYRSTDRGASFQLVNDTLSVLINPDEFFYVLDFVNSKTGYGRRSDGFYKTTDGGASWNQLISVNTSSGFYATKFLNENFGYAYKVSDTIYRTKDGGQNWVKAYVYPDRVKEIFIVDTSIAYVVAENSKTSKTVNGGLSWTNITMQSPYGEYTLTSQYFINDTTGIQVGLAGRILKTSNGGNSWKEYSPTYRDLYSLSFGSPTVAYAVSRSYVYKTTNTGQTWSKLPYTVSLPGYDPTSFEGSWFFSADTGFLVSFSPSKIHHTTDGGQTWSSAPLAYGGPSSSYPGISFPSRKLGYMAANTSAYNVLRTTDGGVNWQPVGTGKWMKKLHFVNDSVGYASTYFYVYRTLDSAKTWTTVLMEDLGSESKLYFINAAKGFVGGDYGKLRMTADSGKTWTPVTLPGNPATIVNIKFFNDSVGYLTFDNGNVYKTVNGGTEWWISARFPAVLNGISFGKDSMVYMAGSTGTIIGGPIAEFNIDSVSGFAASNCNANFSAIIRSVWSQVDSVWFEYGSTWAPGFSSSVLASPYTVNNSRIKATAVTPALTNGMEYRVRVKILYKGAYYYSTPFTFSLPPSWGANAGPDVTICQGAGAILGVGAAAQGYSYSWTPATNINPNQYPTYATPNATTTYYLTISSANCVAKAKDTVTVLVNPKPAMPVITQNAFVLTSSSPIGNRWVKDGVTIPGAIDQTYIVTAPGVYNVFVSINGCNSALSLPLTIWPTGLNGPRDPGHLLVVAPNPVHGKLNISWTGNNGLLSLNLLDINGKQVIAGKMFRTATEINLSGLTQGLYIVQIMDPKSGERWQRFIIRQ